MQSSDPVKVPFARPRLPVASELLPYLERIDQRAIYSNHGPLVQSLESRYAEYLSLEPSQVIAVSSGTLGLSALVSTGSSSSWTCPSWTFAATPSALRASGKSFRFVDVDNATWAVSKRTELGMDDQVGRVRVVPFGTPLSITALPEPCEVVIDAAASLGNVASLEAFQGRAIGVVFSLHATKVLSAGEGGLVVCLQEDWARRVRSWINFGFGVDRVSQFPGTNGKMAEYAAAVAHCSLDAVERERGEWLRAKQMAKEVQMPPGVSLPPWGVGAFDPYWLVRCTGAEMKGAVMRSMARLGVECRPWWSRPCHEMPAFADVYMPGAVPVTNDLAASVVGLPMFRDMTSDDVELIEAGLTAAFEA